MAKQEGNFVPDERLRPPDKSGVMPGEPVFGATKAPPANPRNVSMRSGGGQGRKETTSKVGG
jgi:hypothetical protein